ncbi:DUF4260 domain-containing protein [Halobacillus sp. Marseille-Q1614]|uniref:DUF4260 domain-containing protein n=1 Tax=Halobacillus sp. Marseille-Q1614 TaxID=2709134 RepID=UPI0015714EF9|nr:DUF4260 domain-containing protein [Halobacillus sp. Marseille-Q1614]
MNKLILQLEGLIVLLIAVYFYTQTGGSWVLFFLCLLVPDLSMLGYLKNKRWGAGIYNIGHTYIIPLLLSVFAFIASHDLLLALSLIWIAHIGMDRTIGYGLKYPSDFKDTHLQKV